MDMINLLLEGQMSKWESCPSSEGEMNLIVYSNDGGTLSVTVAPDVIFIEVKDTGPGIADLDLAMTPGYSTAPEWAAELGFGTGMGLVNMQQNSDYFEIRSHIGEGTTIQCRIMRNRDQGTGEQEES